MLNNSFENTMVLLIGFAGTGKYTIGRELSERTGATLVDNHLINNPVFKVVKVDGVTPLPPQVWDLVKEIRATVYEAIRELSPPERSFVFTMHLRQSNTADHAAFWDLAELATARQSRFVPIRLICGLDELCRRVTDPSRAAMLKDMSLENARKNFEHDAVLNVPHPNIRTLDVTKRTPNGSVDAILDEVSAIKVNLNSKVLGSAGTL